MEGVLPAMVGKEGSRNIPGERAARLAVTLSSRSTSVMVVDDVDDAMVLLVVAVEPSVFFPNPFDCCVFAPAAPPPVGAGV